MILNTGVAAVAAASAIAGVAFALSQVSASADPTAPPGAPRKPAEVWQDRPVEWAQLPAGGHWGVWINGDFLPLS